MLSRSPAKPVPSFAEDYEQFLGSAGDTFSYAGLDENDAAVMCYTSGTTGKPKGVVYSHRALVLHSFMLGLKDGLGISGEDAGMPIVPMFHVNAWGLPFVSVMLGAKQVFPGPFLDAENLLDLMEKERVTFAAGVPTIWFDVLNKLDENAGPVGSGSGSQAFDRRGCPAGIVDPGIGTASLAGGARMGNDRDHAGGNCIPFEAPFKRKAVPMNNWHTN